MAELDQLAVLIACCDADFGNVIFSVLDEDQELKKRLPWGAELFEWQTGFLAMVVPRSCMGCIAATVQTLGRRLDVLWDREVDAIAPEAVTSLISATITEREYVAACSIEGGCPSISMASAATRTQEEEEGFGF